MRAQSISSLLGALFIASCLAPTARAADVKQCKNDGKQEYQACKSTCQENFQVAKDMCRNVSHDCAETCRSTRETCESGPSNALDACKQGCETQLDADKEPCKQLEKGSADRDACVDAAQVKAFQCRDTCRENADHAAIQQCYHQFHDCITACPPPPSN